MLLSVDLTSGSLLALQCLQVAQRRLAAIPGCAVEAEPFRCFWPAEEYHQHYLEVSIMHTGEPAVLCSSWACGMAVAGSMGVLDSGPLAPPPRAPPYRRRADGLGAGSARPRAATTPSAATADGRPQMQ